MATDSISTLLTKPPIGAIGAVSPRVQIGATAGGAVAIPAPAAAATPPPSAQSAPSALQTAVASAAATQDGLTGFLSNLAGALDQQSLPTDVQAAATQILGGQLSLDPPPTAQDLQQAIAQSGLFLEAQLADDSAPPDNDMKAALLNLVQALDASAGAASTPASSTSPAPPPPYPGAPLQGQPPATPAMLAGAAQELVAALLSKGAKGALSRQVLMQAASLPRSSQAPSQTSGQTSGQKPGASWLFELLLAAPDGPAVAPFEIDRDGEAPGGGAPDPIWRVRFSLDFAPIGPIHARISLSGGRAHVALWAEDGNTRSMLDEQQGDLTEALLEDELIAEVAVFQGKPNATPAPAGQFMNRSV